jgi:tRNA threonylcarbamoyladenosine biosynthesis protein TsaB
LAFDTAGTACSAAAWRSGKVVARRFEAMQRGQSERLVPMIEEVMATARLDYAALDAVAVTLGPGGFTGVRIGLATARGLALACGAPVLGVSSFEAVAAAVDPAERRDRRLAVLLDAKRADLFVQVFGAALEPLGKPACVTPGQLAGYLPDGALTLAGDAVDQALEALAAARGGDLLVASAPGQVDAGRLAELAAALPLPAPGAAPPMPLYLRPPDVTLPPGEGGLP